MSTHAADVDNDYWAWLRYARLSLPAVHVSPPPAAPLPADLRERLAPLIFHNLYRHGHTDQVPEALHQQLRQETLQTVSMQALYRNWLIGFGQKLAAAGVDAILLKGGAFNGWLYPDSAPRYSVDVDLWVHPAEFEPVCALMEDTHQATLLDDKRKATHQRLFERVFMPKRHGLPTVEIHRGLTNPHLYRVDALSLLATSTPHPTYDNPALQTLSPCHNLLNLALHCSRDRDFANYSLLDAHELWCQTHPNPDELLKEARQWQACTPLFFLLWNAAATMETPVPGELLEALRPTRWRQQLTAKTVRLHPASAPPPEGRQWQIVANFALTDRVINALMFQWDYLKMRMADAVSR